MKNDFDKIKRAVQELSMMVFEYSERVHNRKENRKALIKRLLSFDRLSPDEQERSALDALRSPLLEELSATLPPTRNNEVLQLNNLEDNEKGIVEFNEKEINTMPKNLKRLIIIQKKRCRLRVHPSGKNSVTYEIRFRCDGYDVSACGKTIELAKENFIKKFKTAKPVQKSSAFSSQIPMTFTRFALYYFENYRKIKVSPLTYKIDLGRFNRHIQPYFEDKPLKKITPKDCQALLNRFTEKGQGKTADEIYSLLNVTFKCAISHGLINFNPLNVVPHVQHDRESGKALSHKEEFILFEGLKAPDVALTAALMLFCGLRPNEVKTACVDGLFIKAVNSKRKTKKVQYKRIPIIKRLRLFLPSDNKLNVCRHDKMRKEFKKLLPEHKTYDLRTTFYTRCDEFGVSEPARDEFVGHSSGVLTNTYRDLSDEYLLKEAKKLDLW